MTKLFHHQLSVSNHLGKKFCDRLEQCLMRLFNLFLVISTFWGPSCRRKHFAIWMKILHWDLTLLISIALSVQPWQAGQLPATGLPWEQDRVVS